MDISKFWDWLLRRKRSGLTFGCVKDPEDNRDFILGAFLNKRKPIPDQVNLQQFTHEPGAQGLLPGCVAWGTAKGMMETVQTMNNEWSALSVLWLYDQCKRIDGDPNMEGTYIRTAMKILAQKGCVPEIYLPYDQNYKFGKYDKEIALIPEQVSRPFRIKTYARLKSVDEMCRCLDQNGPFAMGVEVTEDFIKPDLDGLVIPLNITEPVGGHCIAAVGFDTAKAAFLIMNSWSTMWGVGGYAWLSFDYWEKYGLDAWGIIDINPNEI